jgi:hypothetical protein
VTGGEYQAGLDPGPIGPGPVSVLLLLAEPECGDAEVRKGEWRLSASEPAERLRSFPRSDMSCCRRPP